MTRRKRKSQLTRLVDWLYADSKSWCAGRLWYVRAPLLLFFAYVLVNHLQDPLYSDAFKPLNLCIHELGHYVFAPLGQFMNILGGSLFQTLVPIAAIPMFFRQRDYFAITICFGWFSTNLFDVATYVEDARAMELPLVSPGAGAGGDIIHDWNWLLETMHLLPYDHGIAQFIRLLATLAMLLSVTTGAWLCWMMFSVKPEPKEPQVLELQ